MIHYIYKAAYNRLLGLSEPLLHAKLLEPWTSPPLQNMPAHSPYPKQWPGGESGKWLELEEGLVGKGMF